MRQSWTAAMLLLVTFGSPRTAALVVLPFVPPPDELLRAEGITTIPRPPSAVTAVSASSRAEATALVVAAEIVGGPLDRASWTVQVDSFQPGEDGSRVLDGDQGTFWQTADSPTTAPLPHTITINLQSVYPVNGLTYLPRQDGNLNGNIGRHEIRLSMDGTNFGPPVAIGTYLDDATLKATSFEPQRAQYVQLIALTEAGGRGPWTSAAEINVYAAADTVSPPSATLGRWGPTIDFPIVPVAGAITPGTGRVVTWSAFSPREQGGSNGLTVTATYDPSSGVVSQRTVSNTGHDMFCPGISMDVDGRYIVSGGSNAERTSIYTPGSDSWSGGANMQRARGYQSTTTCSDGRIFNIGGSFSGGLGGKDGEIYDPTSNTWTSLPGCPVTPMLTADTAGVFRSDNHAWLFGWRDGSVFQAGPSRAMNWYSTRDVGSRTGAGDRAADGDSMCGVAVMYDAVAGKILTAGGSPNYQGSAASRAAHVITIGDPNTNPLVTAIDPMNFPRTFANAVVLPDGKVLITGGQTFGSLFSDELSVLTSELWDPANNRFQQVAANSIPRTYHSIALLMQDGTVFVGGGGLCGTCSANHFDAQIYTPPYLLNPDGSSRARPVINSVSPSGAQPGATLTINTDSAIGSISLVRYSSATHSVNTDQRRVPLTPQSAGANSYTVILPSDSGVLLPGYWMLFVMNSVGVPSVAWTIQVRV